jgi:hypothetical protein
MQQAQAETGGTPGSDAGGRPGGRHDDGVVDAEFEEVGDGRKPS